MFIFALRNFVVVLAAKSAMLKLEENILITIFHADCRASLTAVNVNRQSCFEIRVRTRQ